jgi:hypothetical protein
VLRRWWWDALNLARPLPYSECQEQFCENFDILYIVIAVKMVIAGSNEEYRIDPIFVSLCNLTILDRSFSGRWWQCLIVTSSCVDLRIKRITVATASSKSIVWIKNACRKISDKIHQMY